VVRPITVADQGTFITPEDADDLVDLLTEAATVIGHLAGHPAAEDALAGGRSGPRQDCAELTIDLRLAAARLDEDTTSSGITGYIKKDSGKGDDAINKRPRHAGENQHSADGR
jgi:hypothetical protein